MAFTQVASLIYIEGSFELLTHPHYSHTYPHHLASPHPLTLPAGSILLAGDSMYGRQIQWNRVQKSSALPAVELWYTVGAAMLHCWCNYAAPLVPECFTLLALPEPLIFLCWTDGIPMLDCWYSYAEPLVYLCCTFGTRMLYSSGTVFLFNLQPIFQVWFIPIHLTIIYIVGR